MKNLFALSMALLVLAGCGQKAEQPSPPAEPASSVQTGNQSKTVDASTVGTVAGKITYSGPAPVLKELAVKGNPECAIHHTGKVYSEDTLVGEGGGLKNVVVYVKSGLEGYSFPAPAEPVVIDNKACLYAPHVAVAQAGQPITFMNEDATLHNVHSYAKNQKGFNVGLPMQGMKQTRKFDVPEISVQLKCDVHPWMIGWVAVVPNPYAAVSAADGTFSLKNLPPGNYVIEAWHEKLGTQTMNVTLGASESKQADFTFAAPAA